MKFAMTHHFDCTPEELWEIFESREFDVRLEEETAVRREVLEESTDDNGVVNKKLRCISLKEMPGVMKKAIGSDHLEFEQTNELDLKESILKWEVVTPFLTDRVEAGGTTRVDEAEGGGCTRNIQGEINIKLPLVGKKMEKKLSENLSESYEKAAGIARAMIAERQEEAVAE